ncbi:PLP-dependent aminotransferase family protein [Streptomyces sp. MST-110588]|uniref:MocR-like pyridoxine biosynthesis transcription factor PdxR n=1 Tax=Streptomyces sp. MST-110588 TaxID=2833628 RepID=UPI001F5C5047|nr:PLP-dependent aminotransferase family protein [Streptomyces sp. MST-110588]
MDLHLEIDPGSGRRRDSLERALRTAIRERRLAPGSPLPSTRALAQQLRFSRGTVSAAYDQLAAEGYLTARQGSVTTVARTPPPGPGEPAPDRGTAAMRTGAGTQSYGLGPGTPDVTAFPTRAWLQATRKVLTTSPAAVHHPCEPQGRVELRTALAEYLGRTRGVLTDPGHIVITSGFYQSVGLLARVLKEAGAGAVAMEDPGHPLHREAVRRCGLDVLPVPVDEHGAVVASLPAHAAAAVVTPAHQYPTGVPLHPRRRHALRDWAVRNDALIVEDDYDGEFRFDRRPVGAFQGLAPAQTVYCGSVSKTLGPGLRLGWMAVPPALLEPVVRAKLHADIHTETLNQLVLAELITHHHYDRHVRLSRLRYRRRRELLLSRLGGGPDGPLPGLAFHGVPAGLHVLATLPPDGPTEEDLLAEHDGDGHPGPARHPRHGFALGALSGLRHAPRPGQEQGVLIGYAAPPEHAFSTALAEFAAFLEGCHARSTATGRRPVGRWVRPAPLGTVRDSSAG